MPFKLARTLLDEGKANPLILVKSKKQVNSSALKDELTGTMRAIRHLRPTAEDNFSLNDISDVTDVMRHAFVSINIAGGIIGALAFIVGIFGVATVMFVTVNERTSQIGLKKAVGARHFAILTEFIVESAFLCLVGGGAGLLLVAIFAQMASFLLRFPLFLSPGITELAILISFLAGILAGFVPATKAAHLNPVEAMHR